jgi:hypothetical protein
MTRTVKGLLGPFQTIDLLDERHGANGRRMWVADLLAIRQAELDLHQSPLYLFRTSISLSQSLRHL